MKVATKRPLHQQVKRYWCSFSAISHMELYPCSYFLRSLSVICHDSVLSEGHKKYFKGKWLILSQLTFFNST